MKRFSIVTVLVAVLILAVIPAATSASSPQAVLTSAFHAGFTGGNGAYWATYKNCLPDFDDYPDCVKSPAAFLAAPSLLWEGVPSGAVRIIPGLFDQTYCETNTFGIWWVIFDDTGTKENLAATEVHIWFDGEELDLQRTPVRKNVHAEPWHWASVGVPVYGTLAPGEYEVESTVQFPGFPEDYMQAQVTILAEADC